MIVVQFLTEKFVRVGLFVAIAMLMPSIVRATCVAIDDYTMSNGRRIVCFGDCHINSFDGAKAEQDVWVEVAREHSAYCIVEDGLGYKGDNLDVRNVIDNDLFHRALLYPYDIIKYPTSAIAGLAARCATAGLQCYNAEYRYAEIASIMKKESGANVKELAGFCESMIQEIEEGLRELREDSTIDRNELDALRSSCDHAIFDLRHRVETMGDEDSIAEKASMPLFDARLIAHLKQLLANQEDKRTIFIFVGLDHAMKIKDFLYCKYVLYGNAHHKITSDKVDSGINYAFGKIDRIPELDQARRQEELRKVVDKYRFDIRDYFANGTVSEGCKNPDNCVLL